MADFDWDSFVAAAMAEAEENREAGSPFYVPAPAEPVAPAPVMTAPVAVAPPPMTQDASPFYQPYATPPLADNPAGRLMGNALGQLRGQMGVTPDGASLGKAGGQYRDDWERRIQNQGKNFDDTVIDYRGSGIDTSGTMPTVRVNSITGRQLSQNPFKTWDDLRNTPGSVYQKDDKDEIITDEAGRYQRYDLPGWNGQDRFAGGLYPDRLPNQQQVLVDRNNPGVNWGVGADGGPDRLLIGGRDAQGFTRQQATGYGLNPTTDRTGRPVYYEEQSNRSWARNPDGSAGREILGVNSATPTYRDGGQRANQATGGGQGRGTTSAGGSGAAGGGTGGVTRPDPVGNVVERSADGNTVVTEYEGKRYVATWDPQKLNPQTKTPGAWNTVVSVPFTPTVAPASTPPLAPDPDLAARLGGGLYPPTPYTPPAPSYTGPDGRQYASEAEFQQRWGMPPDAYQRAMADYNAQRDRGNYAMRPPQPRY